jgi:hypothetical protein
MGHHWRRSSLIRDRVTLSTGRGGVCHKYGTTLVSDSSDGARQPGGSTGGKLGVVTPSKYLAWFIEETEDRLNKAAGRKVP